MHRLCLILSLLLIGCDRKPAPPPAPRVLIISIDGLRPDLILRNHTPNIHLMMERGAFSFYARTTEISITLPSHTSMLTGATPERHNIWWNDNAVKSKEHPPAVPSIFELAKQGGYSTGMAAGKGKFDNFLHTRSEADPKPVDWSYVPADYAGNSQVASAAVRIISKHQPQVMFVHLPDTDKEGHAGGKGWGSAAQGLAVEAADAAVGEILAAYQRQGLLDQTIVILSADHGGSGTGHGAEDFRSRYIPWIICGPGVRRNYDLTLTRDLIINTEDTFATACFHLKIPLDEDLDGKPITQAFEDAPKTLMRASP